jgi:hypothetical protein
MTGRTNEAAQARKVPIGAMILGGAGLLPPVLAILIRLGAGGDVPLSGFALRLAILYAMLILSFLGGSWWGAGAAKAPPERQSAIFALAVAPTIAALLLFVLAGPYPLVSTILLALFIAASPLADAWLSKMGLMPPWWMRLRVPLSLLLGVLVLGLAALLAL